MHQVQVDVVHTQILEGRGNAIFDPVVPRVIELSGDPDLVAGNTGIANARTNLGLVAIGQGCVDVTVALQQGVLDRLADLIGLGLPGSQADGGDLVTGVEGVGLPRGGRELVINCGIASPVARIAYLVCWLDIMAAGDERGARLQWL